MKIKKFKDSLEYQSFLKKQFEYISKTGEYNIFLHCVTAYTSYYSEIKDKEEDVQRKIEGIFKKGLDLDGAGTLGVYSSIKCTAKFFGELGEIDNFEKFVNYDYFSHSKMVYNIILLIPKYINVDGNKIEFSSLDNDIKYKKQHDKTCVFDVVKDRFSPVEYIFGCQLHNLETGEFKLKINENFLAFLNKDRIDEINQYFADKFKKVMLDCKKEYNIETIEDVLKKKTEEHMKYINDFIIDP